MAVDVCVAVRTGGWCGLFFECDRCVGGIKRAEVCAVVKLCGCLVVVNLKSNDMIGADAKLNGGGDVTNAG